MKISSIAPNVYFGRKPSRSEQIEGRGTIQEGLEYLDKKNVSMIIPMTSFPVSKNGDTGVGSPYTKAGREFSKNILLWGFNSQQYLPSARLEKGNPVPYVGSVFSTNELVIDLKALTEEKWGCILDKEIYFDIINSKPKEEQVDIQKSYDPKSPDYDKKMTETLSGDNIIFYNYAWSKYDPALYGAFEKLKTRATSKQDEIYTRFQEFSMNPENNYWLEKDALYYALSKYYGVEFYPVWEGENSEIDKNLFNSNVDEDIRQKRIKQINDNPELKDEIEFYKFKQFVLSEQNRDYREFCKNMGCEIASLIKNADSKDYTIKSLDDSSSGLGNSQKWGYPDIFVKGWTLGCLPDGNWQYKLIDFKKLYNKDGTLAPAGEFLYNKFSKTFKENNGGIRIDHSQGYINPQVTPEGKSITDEKSGKLRTSLNGTDLFKEYLVFDESRGIENITKEELDELGQVFDIILKAAEDNGVSRENIMFEAFDDVSQVTEKILEAKNLGKISLARWDTDWFKTNQWAILGNHDNDSLREWTDGLFEGKNLYGTLEDYVGHLKKELLLTDEEVESILNNKDIEDAKKNFIKYQFIKLFASKAQNIQVFFTDFFGTDERYQRANVPDVQNWRIKVHSDYENEYYENLVKGYGLNMPEVIMGAILHKARRDGAKIPNDLVEKLNNYSNILKEE